MAEDTTHPAGDILEMVSINLVRASNFRLDPSVLQMQVPDIALAPVGVDVETPVDLPAELYYNGFGPQPVLPASATFPPPPPPGSAPAIAVQPVSAVGSGSISSSSPVVTTGNGNTRGPPKPPNRWILFLKANYHEVLAQNPGMHTSKICKYISSHLELTLLTYNS